ncbi:hypothetical protein AHAS_Ahas05G0207100 [Arachis hypogaea]
MLSRIQNLQSLVLQENQLSGKLPDSLGKLEHLEILDLSTTPSQVLNLASNSLIGDLLETLEILSNLVTLDLSSNLLEGPMNKLNFLNFSKLKELRYEVVQRRKWSNNCY